MCSFSKYLGGKCSIIILFMYGDKYFKQTDGVTMGSPLGPTMANFCLSHFENQLLEECGRY